MQKLDTAVAAQYAAQVKAVFFDIDDTLYMKDGDLLRESVEPALRRLQDAGILVGIASGRVEASFPEKITALTKRLGIDTFVTGNGQFVKCKGKILRNAALPVATLQPLIHFLQTHHIDYATLNNDALKVSAITPKLRGALDPITLNYQVDPNYYLHHPVLQVLAFFDESQDHLFKHNPILDGLKVLRWHEDSVDIFIESGSKAMGIARVAEYLGFGMENVMAFGDGLNDIEMLSEVGVGVAMGNAHPELVPHAKHQTLAVHEDGVAAFLAQIPWSE